MFMLPNVSQAKPTGGARALNSSYGCARTHIDKSNSSSISRENAMVNVVE